MLGTSIYDFTYIMNLMKNQNNRYNSVYMSGHHLLSADWALTGMNTNSACEQLTRENGFA